MFFVLRPDQFTDYHYYTGPVKQDTWLTHSATVIN